MYKFKVGDRVLYIGTYSPELKGQLGVVVRYIDTNEIPNSHGNINVKWDKQGLYMGVFPENIELFGREPQWTA